MIKFFVVAVTSLILSFLSFSVALGSIAKSKAPDIAMQSWPPNGIAYSNFAKNKLTAEFVANSAMVLRNFQDFDLSAAKRGFVTEPTGIGSVQFLAFHKIATGDVATGRQLMRLLAENVRRDEVTNMWLVQDYGKLGNVEKVLDYYDLTLRSSSTASSVLIPTLAKGLANDEFIAPMRLVLAKNPPWAGEFWQKSVAEKESLPNIALLRQQIEKDGIVNPADNDGVLLMQLVTNGFIEEATILDALLSPEANRSGLQAVRNHDFSGEPGLPPFGWQLSSTGDYEARLDPRNSRLNIDALSDSSGIAGQQLLKLAAADYRLTVKSVSGFVSAPPVSITLICAEQNTGSPAPVELDLVNGESSVPFSVGDDECGYFWLMIRLRALDERGGYDVSIEEISILPQGE